MRKPRRLAQKLRVRACTHTRSPASPIPCVFALDQCPHSLLPRLEPKKRHLPTIGSRRRNRGGEDGDSGCHDKRAPTPVSPARATPRPPRDRTPRAGAPPARRA
eukprot:scaffold34593_cov124-Isochrysis_galbana.AAC.1